MRGGQLTPNGQGKSIGDIDSHDPCAVHVWSSGFWLFCPVAQRESRKFCGCVQVRNFVLMMMMRKVLDDNDPPSGTPMPKSAI
jgi:hypothetical protein